MKKRLAFVVLLLIIFVIFGIVKSTNAQNSVIPFEKQSFNLIIETDEEEVYKNDKISILKDYDTIFIDMNEIFKCILGGKFNQEESQEVEYNGMNFYINLNENVINLHDAYKINTTIVDDSIDIEIEERDGVKYVPLYFISNLPNVDVEIDEVKLYKSDNYINSVDALDNTKTEHIIKILLNEEDDDYEITYRGEQPGALWREEAYKRIEKYRKSDLKIIVQNQNGRILNNVNVKVKMQENDFKFGTAIRENMNTHKNLYDNVNKNLFNTILSENGNKWKTIYNKGTAISDDVVSYAKENDMYLRGHCLWWDYACAETMDIIGNIDEPKEGTMAYVYFQYTNGYITEEEADMQINELIKKLKDIVFSHIEEQIKDFPEIGEWDVVNEPISKQYFKYYLFDKNLLYDNNFLNNINKSDLIEFTDNDNYYQFLAECFDKAKGMNNDLKLVFNDGQIDGNKASKKVPEMVKVINNINNYTDNIDSLGVQYHVYNNYRFTPQSYYNQINDVLKQTGINDFIVTEYDNYVSSKLNNYTVSERKTKANYLRDSLISVYSNPSASGFVFWVYNSKMGMFVDEEYKQYEELMKEWLTDEQNVTANVNGGYDARVYQGKYLVEATLNDHVVEKVVDTNENSEVLLEIESKVEKIQVDNKPDKTEYIQNFEELNLEGGIIKVFYDDGTVEYVEMNSKDVQVSGFDNSEIGYNTITLMYGEKEVTFTVKIVQKSIVNLEISKKPKKLEYINKKEKIDLSGGILTVYYNDNTKEDIFMTSKEIKVEDFNNTILGEQQIKIIYQDNYVYLDIKIIEDEENQDIDNNKNVSKIEIIQLPTKQEYIQNYEELDLTGGIILVIYEDNTSEQVDMTSPQIVIKKFSNVILGNQEVVLEFRDFEFFITVNIIEKTVEEITVESMPIKLNYFQNIDQLDLNGGKIKVVYSDKTEEIIAMDNEFVKISGFDNSICGERAVVVEYEGERTTFVVNILEKSNDLTVSKTILPAAGNRTILIALVIFLILFMVIPGSKYLQYKKDTRKQILKNKNYKK